jgi:hypothetical protein
VRPLIGPLAPTSKDRRLPKPGCFFMEWRDAHAAHCPTRYTRRSRRRSGAEKRRAAPAKRRRPRQRPEEHPATSCGRRWTLPGALVATHDRRERGAFLELTDACLWFELRLGRGSAATCLLEGAGHPHTATVPCGVRRGDGGRHRSHFDIADELRAFEEAFVSELRAGEEQRVEAKRRKAEARADNDAAASARRRQEQEEWLEGEYGSLSAAPSARSRDSRLPTRPRACGRRRQMTGPL